MMANSLLQVVDIVRSALRLSRREARGWAEWAVANPSAAALQFRTYRELALHRARVLDGRRWAFRKAHRVRRWRSLAHALEGLAEDFARRQTGVMQ